MVPYGIARICAAGLLLGAVGDWPYDYYTLTRIVACVVGGYGAHVSWTRKDVTWAWAFGFSSLLFNPFAPVHLTKSTWALLDILGGGLFAASALRDVAAYSTDAKRRRESERREARAQQARANAENERRTAEVNAARAQVAKEAQRFRRWQERVWKK